MSSINDYLDISLPSNLRNEDEVIEFLMKYLTLQSHFRVDNHMLRFAVAILSKEKKMFMATRSKIIPEKPNLKKSNFCSSEKKKKAEKAKEDGNAHFKERRFCQAVGAYSLAITLDPKYPLYYLNRCIAHFYMGEMDKSLRDAIHVLRLCPFHPKAYQYLGKAYLSLGFTSKAEYCLSCAKTLDPDLTGIDDELSKVKGMQSNTKMFMDLIKEKKLAESLQYLNLIIDATPHKSLLYRKLVEDLCKNDMVEEAKMMVTFLPEEVNLEKLYLLGLCAYYKDDEEAVHENFSKYLNLFPQNYHAKKRYIAMQDIYHLRQEGDKAFSSGHFEAAIKLYLKGIEHNYKLYAASSVSAKIFYKIAKAQLKLNKRSEAIFSLDSAIKLDKDYHDAIEARGECLIDTGKYEEGLKDVEKALKIYPCDSCEQLLKMAKQKQSFLPSEKLSKWTSNKDENEDLALQKSLADSKKEIGNQLFKAGKYTDAIEAYDEAIKLYSKNHVYFSNRSACHLALKNFRDALRDAESALRIAPSYLKALLRLAKCQIALGQAEEAVNSLEKAMKFHPDVKDLKMEMGRAKSLKDCIAGGDSCLMSEDYVDAERDFSSAVKFGEACVALHLKEIECLYHLGRYEEAVSAVESAFNLDAQNPALYYFKGLCCYQQGERNEAIILLEKSLSVAPIETKVSETLKRIKNVFQFKDLGNKAVSENRLQDALLHYSEGLKEDNTNKAMNAVFHFNIGLVHRRKGELNEAVDSFSTAIALKEDYVKAYLNRAECRSESSCLRGAVKDYEIVVKISPSSEHEKRLEEAKRKLQIQVELPTKEKELEMALAQCKMEKGKQYFQEKKYKDALECFSTAISLNPECPSYYVSRCRCYVALKDYYKAVREAEKSVEVDPSYVEGYTTVGECNMSLGNAEKACSAFEKVRELDFSNEKVVNEIVKSLKLKSCLKEGYKALGIKNFVAASEQFKIAFEIAVWNSSLLIQRMKCLIYLHRMNEVSDIFESLNTEMKDDSNILCLKGMFFYYQDKKDDALKSLKYALEVDSSNEEAKKWTERIKTVYDLKEKGNEAFVRQDYVEAFLSYEEALKMEPNGHVMQSKLHFNIGMLHMKQKRFSDAVDSFSTAIILNGDYIKALEKRANCYCQMKDFQEAVQDYQKLYNLTSSKTHLKLLQKLQEELERAPVKDYYSILGLSRDSSMEEIRRSYRRLALKFHPDRMTTEADKIAGEKKFKEINKAHSVLSDSFSRERYDRGEIAYDLDFSAHYSSFDYLFDLVYRRSPFPFGF